MKTVTSSNTFINLYKHKKTVNSVPANGVLDTTQVLLTLQLNARNINPPFDCILSKLGEMTTHLIFLSLMCFVTSLRPSTKRRLLFACGTN